MKNNDTYRIPKQVCPYCAYKHDAAGTAFEEDIPEKPVAGSVSLCLRCGGVTLYGADLVLRKPTMPELLDLKTDPEQWALIERARRAIDELNRTHPWKK